MPNHAHPFVAAAFAAARQSTETTTATALLATLASLGATRITLEIKHGQTEACTFEPRIAIGAGPTLDHALVALLSTLRIRMGDDAEEQAAAAKLERSADLQPVAPVNGFRAALAENVEAARTPESRL